MVFIAQDQAGFVWMQQVWLAMWIQQPNESGNKAWQGIETDATRPRGVLFV